MNSTFSKDLFPLEGRLMRLALVLLTMWSVAARGGQEGDFEFQSFGNNAMITGYFGPGGAVVIPDELGGYPVTSVYNQAFEFASLTSVTIPHSVI